jgi:hypothetical protein
MPISTETDDARGWVMTRTVGDVTLPELQAHLDEEERLRALGRPELIDAIGATTDVTSAQVRTLVHNANAILHGGAVGPTAIVADDDVAFGMARMYQLLAELDGISVGVFRNRADAKCWLSIVDGAAAAPG